MLPAFTNAVEIKVPKSTEIAAIPLGSKPAEGFDGSLANNVHLDYTSAHLEPRGK